MPAQKTPASIVLKLAVYVFLGGGLGALMRYGILLLAHQSFGLWPWGVCAINLLGSAVLGYLYFFTHLPTGLHAFVAIGFLGSLTTFSTFALDAYVLILQKQYLSAMLFVIFNVAGSVGLVAFFYNLKHSTL